MEEPVSGNIITLQNARRSRVVCPETGVTFPQLYRLTGKAWALREGAELNGCLIKSSDDLIVTDDPIVPAYMLEYGSTYSNIAEPVWEPISWLDPDIDQGWVMIRHHESEEALEAYVDAMYDTEVFEPPQDRWKAFRTSFGFFSLLHRHPVRDTPDHLVVYITKVYDPILNGPIDWHRVIGPGGKVLESDVLYPPDEVEQFQPLLDLLNDE